MQKAFNDGKVSSSQNLYPSYTEKLQSKLSLGYHIVLKKIAESAVYVFKSDYFNQLNKDCDIKIVQIQSRIHQQNLPRELRKYLIATTMNVPSLKAYSEGRIEERSKKYFEIFKTKFTSDTDIIRKDSWHKKEVDRIDRSITRIERDLMGKSQAECLEGVCQAMISRVAKDLLNATDEKASISAYVDKYTKGVDEKTAGLQLFADSMLGACDFQSHLTAVDSLLGLAASPLEPDQFNASRSGVYHLAIPISFGLSHSMLLHINSDTCQFLDPNLGVFQVPTSELKDFLKDHYTYYVKILSGKKAVDERLNFIFSDNNAQIFEKKQGGIEIRQLEKATQHRWEIGISDNRYVAIWQRAYSGLSILAG